jgi:hypothetical protein
MAFRTANLLAALLLFAANVAAQGTRHVELYMTGCPPGTIRSGGACVEDTCDDGAFTHARILLTWWYHGVFSTTGCVSLGHALYPFRTIVLIRALLG